jgi:hypothetical protein
VASELIAIDSDAVEEAHAALPDEDIIEYRLDDHHVAALFKEAEFHADHLRRGLPDLSY